MSYSCFCLHEAFSGYEFGPTGYGFVFSGCKFAPSVLLCDRLTCPAQPGHGGKRSDSPERGITSAVTELTQAIDHNRNNLIENWLNIHIFCCWVNYEMLSFSRLLAAQPESGVEDRGRSTPTITSSSLIGCVKQRRKGNLTSCSLTLSTWTIMLKFVL